MGPPALKPPPAGVFLLPPKGGTPSVTGQPLGPPSSVALSPALSGHFLGPPPSVSPALGPPLSSSPGLSTTPGQTLGPPPASSFTPGAFSTVSQGPVKRSPYVPPPGMLDLCFYCLIIPFGLGGVRFRPKTHLVLADNRENPKC